MFYRYYYDLSEVPIEKVNSKYLTAGFVDYEELKQVYERFGFGISTVESCKEASGRFRSGVEIHDTYTFTELKTINLSDDNLSEDCVSLYIADKLIVVVDVSNKDGKTKEKFMQALKRHPINTVCVEKIISAFFDCLIGNDSLELEGISEKITEIEKQIFTEDTSPDFNLEILEHKQNLQKLHNYYNQLLDIAETLEENENEILDEDRLIYISNITKKISRLCDDVDSLSNNLNHLQDAYMAFIDQKMNKSMKILTVVATIFLPLTIIVGWYGMNFNMPEYSWPHGYLYVSLISVISVIFFLVLGKIRKWY